MLFMPSEQEKSAFAQRLRIALNQYALKQAMLNPKYKAVKGAADLARQFNLRYTGNAAVSVQATHKWLTGRVIPKADKLRTLSEWLGVSEHWLHYGPPPEGDPLQSKPRKAADTKYPPSPQMVTLARKIEALPEHQRYLVEELVTQFYGKLPN